MTPEEIILSIPSAKITLEDSFFDPVFFGTFNGQKAIFRMSDATAIIESGKDYKKSDLYAVKEYNFLIEGEKKKISFLPNVLHTALVDDDSPDNINKKKDIYFILAKQHIPGKTLSFCMKNSIPFSADKCEKDISSQILELYEHGLCPNDIARRNILYDSKKDKFTLFDFDCGTIHKHNSSKLKLETVIALKRLYYTCCPNDFGNIQQYLRNRLKTTKLPQISFYE
ncbi:MAG: hypothetical protein ACP5N3_01715 [Candidatus Nanoarchaeia archaeon]